MISISDSASLRDDDGDGGSAAAIAALGSLAPCQAEMVGLLGDLVEVESGSDDLGGLAAMADRLDDLFGEFAVVARHDAHAEGLSHLVLDLPGTAGDRLPHVVVLGHFDTVWPRGTLERMPFAVDENGIARGPGCFDMKGGLVLLYFALRELKAAGERRRRDIRVIFNCDEEIGSISSRELIKAVGTGARAALVLESPLPGGALKTARKGTGIYRLEISGRAAHAGIEPERGASAVVELAHQILALDALNDYGLGTTINVGIVEGGSRLNVTPARATAEMSIRAVTAAEAERIDAAISGLRPQIGGTAVNVTAGPARPPMQPTAESMRLFGHAKRIAAEIGMPDLQDGATGGGSDGNLVAALGVPTLDGLGPEGGGAHADDEHVIVASMPRRAALLAGLLTELNR
jgi:glutamate carboxypeptidase